MGMLGANALRKRDEPTEKEGVAHYTPNPSLRAFRGTVAGLTFRRDGTILVRPEYRDVKSPLQMATRARMRIAAEAWGGLTPEEALGWRRYADLVFASGERSATGRTLRPYDLFCGLGCKLLQIHGGTDLPRTAPERPFLGDALAIQSSGIDGAVRFEANGPNGPLALSELLLQPLKRASIQPQPDRYRTRAFVAFSPDALTAEIAAKPGAYATAVRHVLSTTGQASRLVPLGVVVVTGGR